MINLLKNGDRMALGESPFWSHRLEKWMWVDITRQIVFQKSEQIVATSFSEMVSNIFECPSATLVTAETKLYQLIDNGRAQVHKQLFGNASYRCNDGGVGPCGKKYWFGTMEKHPTGPKGNIYSLDACGNLVDHNADIGIPNTFIWLDESHILISDSLIQKTYKVELLASGILDWINRKVWLDLSSTRGTPDGGAMDDDGNIWLAVWGDASIHRYSSEGLLLGRIELEALQPTSCAFGGQDMDEMLITTAIEGMSEAQISQYPDSGKVLVRKMNVTGKALPLFDLEV